MVVAAVYPLIMFCEVAVLKVRQLSPNDGLAICLHETWLKAHLIYYTICGRNYDFQNLFSTTTSMLKNSSSVTNNLLYLMSYFTCLY